MTGDTTPPAVRLLAERLWKDHDSQYSSGHLTWVDFEPEARGHLQALADAGLLCSSPVVQPEDQDGSLRSEPSAPGPQWAVLRPDDHNIYRTETSARRVLLFLGEDGEEGYRLYEVREVPRG